MYYAWFWQTVYCQQFLISGSRINYSVNIENYFLYTCYQNIIFHSKSVILIVLCLVLTHSSWLYYAWFWQTVYCQQFLISGSRINYSVNIENYFLYTCYQNRIFHSKSVILIVLCLVLTHSLFSTIFTRWFKGKLFR